MKLLHLRIACYLYNQLTDYDDSYLELSKQYPNLDMNKTEHIKSLIKWLRSWGCRQFKKEDENISIKNITDWYQSTKSKMPSRHDCLIDYNLEANKKLIIESFNNLSDQKVATRQLKDREIDVRIGPVGSAKVLFALRPNLFPPWDKPIYMKFKLEDSGYGYYKYLLRAQNELREIKNSLKETELEWNDLFEYLGKKHTSYPKLIDEYYWIKITQRFDPSIIDDFVHDFYFNKHGQK
jgi:hypothetical protein